MSEPVNTDLEALRADQAARVRPMSQSELAAFCSGFPPSDCCIATPASLRDELEVAKLNGEVEVIVSPISEAIAILEKLVGSQQSLNLSEPFQNASAGGGLCSLDPNTQPDILPGITGNN